MSKVKRNISNVLCVRLSKSVFGSEKKKTSCSLVCITTKTKLDSTIEEVEQFILSLLESGEDVDFMLGGDMNGRIGNWT